MLVSAFRGRIAVPLERLRDQFRSLLVFVASEMVFFLASQGGFLDPPLAMDSGFCLRVIGRLSFLPPFV